WLAKERKKQAMSRVEGKWILESLVVRGTKIPGEQLKEQWLVIQSPVMRFNLTGKATFKIEAIFEPKTGVPSKVVWAIDKRFNEGPLAGKILRGLTKIEDNSLVICNGLLDGDRPTRLESNPGSGDSLFVYKRAKEQKEKQPKEQRPKVDFKGPPGPG